MAVIIKKMDTNRKKQLQNEFKRRELEKMALSDNTILAKFSKNKLGLKSKELTINDLQNLLDDELLETIIDKIKEILEIRVISNPKKYKNSDYVLKELNESLKAIYYTFMFEMYVLIGDTEKYLDDLTEFELSELLDSYKQFNLNSIANHILNNNIDKIEKEFIDIDKIEKIKIQYIRGHLSKFEIK